jgi:hypothetical protein
MFALERERASDRCLHTWAELMDGGHHTPSARSADGSRTRTGHGARSRRTAEAAALAAEARAGVDGSDY